MTPGSGYLGLVQLAAGSLPPTQSKWSFGETNVEARLGGRWVKVGPEHLELTRGPRKKKAMLAAGLLIAGYHVFSSSKCEYNAFKALLGRAFALPAHQPEPGLFGRIRSLAMTLLPRWLDGASGDTEAWLSHLPGPRRRVLRQALRELQRCGWKEAWGWFSAFVKSEKLDGTDKSGPKPRSEIMDRLIQAPDPHALVHVAPWMWSLTKSLKASWNFKNRIFYASTNPRLLDSWFNANYVAGKLAVCADYAKFDNSHSSESWAFMEWFYSMTPMFADKLVVHILEQWRKPRGKMCGMGWAYRYEADFMNASGRPDTALANAVLNGVVMFLSLNAIFHGVGAEELTPSMIAATEGHISLSVVGDDSLALLSPLPQFTSPEFPHRLSRAIARFGFDASGDKMVVTGNPFDMVFLAMRPYPVGGKWYFGKTLGRCLFKQGVLLQPQDKDAGAWYHGVMAAEEESSRCVPLLHDLVERVLEYRDGLRASPVPYDEHKPWTQGGATPPYDEGTVRYTAAGYGMPLCMFRSGMLHARRIPCFPYVTAHPAFTRVAQYDSL